jgi:predicted enzyme related to lactoylglutathione lyase
MPEQERYIPGVPCWIDTSQPDPQAAAAFYRGLFGWESEDVMPAGSEGRYFIGRIRGGDVAAISSASPDAAGPPVWNTYIWVQNVDETASKVTEAGGQVLTPPFDVMEAGRMAVLADREGAAFCAWQAGSHRGAAVVNEAGSLNFNVLSTRDPQAAKEFYGAVFGWQTLAMGGGAEAWTLPGYGDHLERDRPGLREGMAAMGAPPGFEDVVASMMPITGDQPAHWGVTFAVDDADKTAQTAAELGGTVIVAPFDAPWVRTTVIADPQGATFTASKFVPENKDLAAPAGVATG